MSLHCGSRGAAGDNCRWHVLYTRPQKEFLALRHLAEQRFRGHLPLFVGRTAVERNALKVLFPRYLFVQFDVSRDGWGAIRSTFGAVELLHDATGLPVPVPVGIVEELMACGRAGDGAIDKRQAQPDLRGKELRLLTGPFAYWTGVCERSEKHRVRVLVTIMGRAVPVEVERQDVEPA